MNRNNIRLLRFQLLCILSAFLISWNANCQKAVNRIIIWDVTASMVGTTNSVAPDFGYKISSDIDRDVRDGIIKIISETKDDAGSFRIMPFRTEVIESTEFRNNSAGRGKAINYINGYNIEKRPIGYTNICAAWEAAMSYLVPDRKNIIYLFTDGNQNVAYGPSGTDCLSEIVRKYCALTATTDTYTFFISLNISDNSFSQILSNACSKNLSPVNVTDVKQNGVSLPVSLVARYEPLVINLQDSLSTFERFVSVEGSIPADFNFSAELTSCSDSRLEITHIIKKNWGDKIDVVFNLEDPTDNQLERLKGDPHLSIDCVIRLSTDYHDVSFSTSEIPVKIINKQAPHLNFIIK